MPSSIQLVCLDLGRVVVRICDGWMHALREAGRPVTPTRALDAKLSAQLHDLVVASEVGRMSLEEFCGGAAALIGVDAADVRAMSDAYLLGIYPGALELIDRINHGGIKTACLSNTNVNHWRIMAQPGHPACFPLDRMSYQFASHLIGQRKPDAAIYDHVERTTGLSGGQIAFFDDLQENVDAALRRGWTARLVAHDGDPIRQVSKALIQLGVLSD